MPEPQREQGLPPATVVINVKARLGSQRVTQVRKALEAEGVPVADAVAVHRPNRLKEIVHAAVVGGARSIIVGGGDGTVSAVAGELACRNVSLGVLPMGTGNDFARSLGIPLDWEAACKVPAEGVTRRVDLGRVNGRFFLNAISMGLTTRMTHRLHPVLKRHAGTLAYALSAWSALWEHQPFRATIRSGELRLSLNALQVVVGNGRFHGAGRVIAPNAELDDRRLDLYAVGMHPRSETETQMTWRELWILARVAGGLGSGSHVDHPYVQHLRTRSLHLDAQPAQELDVDGELYGSTPATVEVVPEALTVWVPATPVVGR